MLSQSIGIDNLKVFTLNCWGLRYVSDHRQLRIKLIAQHLSENDYDVVFLQEVWIQSDFEYIRTKTKSLFKFAHMFNNASILGTSGLVILTKWVPQMIHFHPYSINGSPFRPFHGDWFSTKGVAYVRVELEGLNLHLFCTHMHAQYNLDEKITDQYSIHRICQSYELAKFINLMACNCSNTSTYDLIVLAGDMNTSSKELPYRLLVEMTDLKDCYKMYDTKSRKREIVCKKNIKLKYHYSDESSDEELITCGHRENTFTSQTSSAGELARPGKRIDFILYKLRDSSLHHFSKFYEYLSVINNEESLHNIFKHENNFLNCFPERMKINAKDSSGLSFSDHQPVVAKLNFSFQTKSFEDIIDESMKTHVLHVDRLEAEDDGNSWNVNDDPVQVNFQSNDSTKKVNFPSDSHKSNIQKLGAKLKQKLLEDIKSSNLKQIAYSMIPSSCHQPQPQYKRLNSSPLLHDIEDLLDIYTKQNKSNKFFLLVILLFTLAVGCLLAFLRVYLEWTYIELTLIATILFILFSICLVLTWLTYRQEMNAVYAIVNDIHKKKSFSNDGLISKEG